MTDNARRNNGFPDNGTREYGTLGADRTDWQPTASWQAVRERAKLLGELRQFFDSRGFVEIETPLLSHDTVVDRHLHPLTVRSQVSSSPASSPDAPSWLQTSPEFCMKRALAQYRQSIYQITRAFRDEETGRLHNIEFTMLEWYDIGADYQRGMNLLSDLAAAILRLGPATRQSYREAFRQHIQLDPFTCSLAELRTAAPQPAPDFGDDRDGWLDWVLTQLIEPQLGVDRPLILYDYPASQAALACTRPLPDDEPADAGGEVAERFELYVNGIELANGYHELVDAETLTRRSMEENRHRQRDGRQPLPHESRLAAAMRRGFPPCAGVAVGVDRLLMCRLGTTNIRDVLVFPQDRA